MTNDKWKIDLKDKAEIPETLTLVLHRLAPLFEHLAIPDESGARVRCQLEVLRQLKAIRRTSFLTQSAKHAARSIEDELVENFFAARLTCNDNFDVHRDHVDAIFGTSKRAKITSDAKGLVGFRIHIEPRRSMKSRRDIRTNLRVLLSVDSLPCHSVLVRKGAHVELQRNAQSF